VAVAVAISLLVTVFCGEALSARIAETHTTEIECIRPPARSGCNRGAEIFIGGGVDRDARDAIEWSRDSISADVTAMSRGIVGRPRSRSERRRDNRWVGAGAD
jgi:hypothetical protein